MWSRRSELGLGHRKRLQPAAPSPTPTHASRGAFPSAAWASGLSAALSGEGLGCAAREAQRFGAGAPSDQPLHSVLSPTAARCVGQVVLSVRAPGSGQQATCPSTGCCHPAGALFATHTKPLNRLLVLAPVSLLLMCFKQNFTECGPLTLRHSMAPTDLQD